MRIGRSDLINGGCAAFALAAAVVSVWALAGVAGNQQALGQARAALPPAETQPAQPASWTMPSPLVRTAPAQRQAALTAALTSQFAQMELEIVGINERGRRTLGEGLQLVEVEVQARGEVSDAYSLIAWAAVNREAVRLVSASTNPDPDGSGVWSYVLLVVTA